MVLSTAGICSSWGLSRGREGRGLSKTHLLANPLRNTSYVGINILKDV